MIDDDDAAAAVADGVCLATEGISLFVVYTLFFHPRSQSKGYQLIQSLRRLRQQQQRRRRRRHLNDERAEQFFKLKTSQP